MVMTNTTARKTRARQARSALLIATGLALALGLARAQATQNRKESRLEIASGGSINIVNGAGSVSLHSAPGRQVVVSYTAHSDKVEVDQNTTANNQRIELITHSLAGQKPTVEEAKVDYDITVPP